MPLGEFLEFPTPILLMEMPTHIRMDLMVLGVTFMWLILEFEPLMSSSKTVLFGEVTSLEKTLSSMGMIFIFSFVFF